MVDHYIDHSYDFLMKKFGGLVQSLELKNCQITTMQGLSKASRPALADNYLKGDSLIVL